MYQHEAGVDWKRQKLALSRVDTTKPTAIKVCDYCEKGKTAWKFKIDNGVNFYFCTRACARLYLFAMGHL